MAVTVHTPTCMVCNKSSTVQLTDEEYAAMGHMLIQQALPSRTPDFREMVMTGTHPRCWDKIFEGVESKDGFDWNNTE